MNTTKSFEIPRQTVREAWKLVKVNKGSAGVDTQSIEDFEKNLHRNLYKVWNRLSSGTYFPPPVKGVEIPKKTKGTRLLGIPAVCDRVAQTVVKMHFEPIVEQVFLEDSYGYRPGKSAHDAIGVTRKRCWQYKFLVEFDIVKLFDEIPHDLLLKAVRSHTENKWIILYIKRWLTAPFAMPDGKVVERTKGVPQGGVISPVLSNLFLHYVFDVWMTRTHNHLPWARYADDGIVHCRSVSEAKAIISALEARFDECGLKIHPDKTKIVYCGTNKLPALKDLANSFSFLGFCFRKRGARHKKTGRMFVGFLPGASKEGLIAMRAKIRSWQLQSLTHLHLEDLAAQINPVVRGWFQYYGAFYRTELYKIAFYLNQRLARWISKKYKKRNNRRQKSFDLLGSFCKKSPNLFEHWKLMKVC